MSQSSPVEQIGLIVAGLYLETVTVILTVILADDGFGDALVLTDPDPQNTLDLVDDLV
jgi:hypothetical protein